MHYLRNITRKIYTLLMYYQGKIIWEFFLSALVLAALAANTGYLLFERVGQTYTQLISGNIVWAAAVKTNDYVLLVSFVFGFFLFYAMFTMISARIEQTWGHNSFESIRQYIIYALLPASIWLGSLLLDRQGNLDMLWLSAGILLMIGCLLMIALQRGLILSAENVHGILGSSLAAVLFSLFNGMAIALALSRIFLIWNVNIDKWTGILTSFSMLIAITCIFGSWLFLKETRIERFVKKILIVNQIVIPLFFFALIPNPWVSSIGKFYGYSMTALLPTLIVVLILVSWIELYRRFTRTQTRIAGIPAISSMCLIAILVYIKTQLLPVSTISPDDYHVGEFLLPWWLSREFAAIPFWDYVPARGLMNYLPGIFADLFFDGTAPAYTAANNLIAFLYIVVGFLGMSRFVGRLIAFIAILLMPVASGITEIDIIITVCLCFLCEGFLHYSRSCWLFILAFLGVAVILYAPGQGGLLLLSMFPLAAVALFQAYKYEKMSLTIWGSTAALIFIAVAIVIPWPKMMLGAIRYGLEQSSINAIAHGVAWKDGFGMMKEVNPWLWEIIRCLWIGVALVAGCNIWKIIFSGKVSEKQRTLIFLVPIFCLMIFYIPRAAGRIDPNWVSRLGIASVWAVCLVLPVILKVSYDKRKKLVLLLIVTFFMGVISTPLEPPVVFKNLYDKPSYTAKLEGELIEGRDFGLDNIGKAHIEPEHLARLVSIKTVLSILLDPGETYLDTTSRNAQYFYMNYNPPIEVGAVYNLVSDKQQKRAVARLTREKPPVVLVGADNIIFDGGPISLRSHVLYRFLAENYTPLAVDGYIYLVRPDRMARTSLLSTKQAVPATVVPDNFDPNKYLEANPDVAKAGMDPATHYLLYGQHEGRLLAPGAVKRRPILRPVDLEAANLLDRVFYQSQLKSLPIAWGRSFNTLSSQLRPIIAVPTEPTVHDIEWSVDGNYHIVGDNPVISFDLQHLNLRGKDAGILVFDLEASEPLIFKLYWRSDLNPEFNESASITFNAESGKIIVPLDTSPRYLLAQKISGFCFIISNPVKNSSFRLKDINLYQRRIVDEVNQ